MSTKRQARCGYCWQPGHNRLKCPKMQTDATNGDYWAKESLERAKTKKCSYCKGTDHTKATCDQQFQDELNRGWGVWAGINAAISVIKELRIASGAFMYAPIMHRWNDFPQIVQDRHDRDKYVPNYEMINFVVGDAFVSSFGESILDETSPFFRYSALAEPEDPKVVIKNTYSLPGFSKAVSLLDASFDKGKSFWVDKNRYNDSSIVGRQNAVDYATVVAPASDEEVDKLVNQLLAIKPMIVDYTDRKEYRSAERKKNKQESADSVLEDLLKE